MAWFKNKASRPPQQLTASVVRFVGEQDGPPERDLKACFVEQFKYEPTVERAYLARADYDDGTGAHVALCVKCFCGGDQTLNARVADIFADMFGSHEHLDVIFLRDDQEQELSQVCPPFYRAQ